jgi:hypothetical protein
MSLAHFDFLSRGCVREKAALVTLDASKVPQTITSKIALKLTLNWPLKEANSEKRRPKSRDFGGRFTRAKSVLCYIMYALIFARISPFYGYFGPRISRTAASVDCFGRKPVNGGSDGQRDLGLCA